jgi:hypothetical protein
VRQRGSESRLLSSIQLTCKEHKRTTEGFLAVTMFLFQTIVGVGMKAESIGCSVSSSRKDLMSYSIDITYITCKCIRHIDSAD